jgi:primase-polymerase (primpol)-like protein
MKRQKWSHIVGYARKMRGLARAASLERQKWSRAVSSADTEQARNSGRDASLTFRHAHRGIVKRQKWSEL